MNRKYFDYLEKSGNGYLDFETIKKECLKVFPQMEHSRISEMYSLIDMDGDGVIGYSEWIAATSTKR